MNETILVAFLVIGVQLMAPILWAALGELIGEQSGVLNIGVEGVMLFGAFAASLGAVTIGEPVAGAVAAAGVGLLCGLLLAFLYVSRGTDQIITGMLFNVFALGLTEALHDRYLQGSVGGTLGRLSLPLLGDIPFVGRALFGQNALVYVAVVAVGVVYFIMQRSWWGLNARAAGERPSAAESAGLDVIKIRYPAVILGCILPALGGATIVLSSSGGFVPGMTAGRGFVALGVVVLARWKPLAVLGASLMFGIAQSFQFLARDIRILAPIPSDIWLMTPYVVTILAVIFATGSRYPAAVGIPYRKEGSIEQVV